MYLRKSISKLLLLSVLGGVTSPLAQTINVYADEVDNIEYVDTTSLTESLYLTGYLDENNEIQIYTHVGQERGALTTIAIYIGKVLVGYLSASVVDGIVIAATGKSGGEWVATAIKSVVGKPYKSSVYLPSGPYTCPGVVIDHSGMCP